MINNLCLCAQVHSCGLHVSDYLYAQVSHLLTMLQQDLTGLDSFLVHATRTVSAQEPPPNHPRGQQKVSPLHAHITHTLTGTILVEFSKCQLDMSIPVFGSTVLPEETTTSGVPKLAVLSENNPTERPVFRFAGPAVMMNCMQHSASMTWQAFIQSPSIPSV